MKSRSFLFHFLGSPISLNKKVFLQLCALFKSSAPLFAADRSYFKGYCFHLKIDTGMNTKETITKQTNKQKVYERKKDKMNERSREKKERQSFFVFCFFKKRKEIKTHKRFKITLFIRTKRNMRVFGVISPLSSHKMTLKQQLNGEKR